MAGRARFTRKYTDEQLDAFFRAVFIDGRQVATARRMALAGQLGVEAFDLNRGYAYELIKERRETYELEHPEALTVAIDRQLVALAGKALSQSRILAKAEHADPEAIRKTVQALTTARAAIRPEAKATKQSAPTQTNGAEPTTQSETTLTSLLGKAPTSKTANPKQHAPDPVASRAA